MYRRVHFKLRFCCDHATSWYEYRAVQSQLQEGYGIAIHRREKSKWDESPVFSLFFYVVVWL